MRFDILSLFPDMLEGYFTSSILGRAQKKKLIKIVQYDLRKWAHDKHNRVDDTPYGGGPGMVIRVDVVHRALKALIQKKSSTTRILLLSPRGATFDQRVAKRLASYKRIVLIAGRYEAIDARVDAYVDEKISIGNFVLTGGELAAACVVDAVSRLKDGVLGKATSLDQESFSHFEKKRTNIEYPQYTRPEIYERRSVPKVLLSGDHGAIAAWRGRMSKHHRTN
ncbi:MAG: tRNA (guanosine(37)-N1)-methyltransferase TrmD [Candidatus Komeilibacteria bacterium]|nr:tRNA (guanosine(37)-N1)-methyltransferase TrmD [Candidatus Komeilibacteria bacterium]